MPSGFKNSVKLFVGEWVNRAVADDWRRNPLHRIRRQESFFDKPVAERIREAVRVLDTGGRKNLPSSTASRGIVAGERVKERSQAVHVEEQLLRIEESL